MTSPPPIHVEETPAMLHSVAEFAPLLKPLFVSPHISSVCEVGAEQGTFTRVLTGYRRAGFLQRITVVDPVLTPSVKALAENGVYLIETTSLAALPHLSAHDLYVLDGDHNHYTVLNELHLIHSTAPSAIVILHDVGWPCGRRDHYYDPTRLPPHAVHPHSFDLGVLPNRPGVGPMGMVSKGQYAVALEEGGPANGVSTAIEDFLSDHPDLHYLSLNFIHGLGIISPRDHPLTDTLRLKVMPSADCLEVFGRMEANRLRNWLALIETQRALGIQRQATATLIKAAQETS